MPSFYLPRVPDFDPMIDTMESAFQRLAVTTNRNFDIIGRLLYGQLDSVNIRHGGILLEELMGGLLPEAPDTLGAGLNLTPDYMGFFDGDFWKAYIASDGKFFFGGDTDNYILWDGTSLALGGHLDAVTGTFEILGAGDFPDGAKVLIGHLDGDPLFEMYDADDTLRLKLEQDRMSFFTEYIAAAGLDPAIESVYAGMVQGLFWQIEGFDEVPEVRIEVPNYCNIMAVETGFEKRYSRLGVVNTDEEVLLRIVARNEHADGGKLTAPDTFSLIELWDDIHIECYTGSVYMPQMAVLYSNTYDDHLTITRYDDVAEERVTMKVTAAMDILAPIFILSDDAERFVFYHGATPLMEIDSSGGGVLGDKPCIRMYADLEVEGDITFGGWL